MKFFVFLNLLMVPVQVMALTAAYVSFDHPEGWRCELVQGVWICQSTLETEKRESIILSIATKASEWDSLENYEKYLQQPRTIQDEEGNSITSEITYTRTRTINGFKWVDSLQHNSELPGFWTKYLASVMSTRQNKYAILITYVVSEEKYSVLAPQFERMIATLKPNAEFDLNIPSQQGDGPLPGSNKLGPSQTDLLKERLNLKSKKSSSGSKPSPSNIIIIVVAGAAILLLLRRIRKAKARQKHEMARRGRQGSQ